MSVLLLAYMFATFVVGTACVGAIVVLARLRHDELARAFLLLHTALTILVLGGLLLALVAVQPLVAPAVWFGAAPTGMSGARFALDYLESFVGRYGVMLALPLFTQRVFGVSSRRRSFLLTGSVFVAFAAQHVTEFALAGSVWDARGDVMEDVIFGVVVAYTLLLAIRRRQAGVYPPLARRVLAMLLAAVPVTVFDVFLIDGGGLRLYPVWYCVFAVMVTVTLLARRTGAPGAAPRDWELSDRETEVLRLVQHGMSNREIAARLSISPNTVKTHLRSIFDKSGFRTRTALMAQTRHHPIG